MAMPGRERIGSQTNRYGFNGIEFDPEAKPGDKNHYDFGARCYDPRVGRWFKGDPYNFLYENMSPYAFAHNSPIRLIDVAGETPNDANLMILIENYDKPSLTRTGDWTIVKASSMDQALKMMVSAKLDRRSFQSLFVEAHGGGQAGPDDEAAIVSGTMGLIALSTFELLENDGDLNMTQQAAVEDLVAFGNIVKFLKANPTIVMATCGSGKSEKLATHLQKFIYDRVTGKKFQLYMNSSNSTLKTDEHLWEPTFDQNIVKEKNIEYGGFNLTDQNAVKKGNFNIKVAEDNPWKGSVFEVTPISKDKIKPSKRNSSGGTVPTQRAKGKSKPVPSSAGKRVSMPKGRF